MRGSVHPCSSASQRKNATYRRLAADVWFLFLSVWPIWFMVEALVQAYRLISFGEALHLAFVFWLAPALVAVSYTEIWCLVRTYRMESRRGIEWRAAILVFHSIACQVFYFAVVRPGRLLAPHSEAYLEPPGIHGQKLLTKARWTVWIVAAYNVGFALELPAWLLIGTWASGAGTDPDCAFAGATAGVVVPLALSFISARRMFNLFNPGWQAERALWASFKTIVPFVGLVFFWNQYACWRSRDAVSVPESPQS